MCVVVILQLTKPSIVFFPNPTPQVFTASRLDQISSGVATCDYDSGATDYLGFRTEIVCELDVFGPSLV